MNAVTDIKPAILGVLSKALAEIGAAKKNSANPHFKSKYADLGSVLEAIRPIASHGLWFRQVSHENDHGVAVETLYIHESGELSAGVVFVPADKNNAQGFGSAQTYARRYGLQLAFGLATEDDDGNAAAAAPPRAAEGHIQKGAVSPPQSDAPPKTHLDAAEKRMVREIESCGDADMLDAYLASKEAKADYNTLNKFRPEAIHGPVPDGLDGYIPIAERIKAKRDAFQIAALATA
jgi:ERF superfamily